MIQSKDYRAYVCDNKQLIDALKENNSVLISRLSDVFKVLDHIINLERLKKNISDELEVIFETGFRRSCRICKNKWNHSAFSCSST